MKILTAFRNWSVPYRLPRWSDVKQVKTLDRETEREVLQNILAQARSDWALAAARGIEEDKKSTIRALGETLTDPKPLPFTAYRTEAEALADCATPRYAGLLLAGVVTTVQPSKLIEIGAAHGYGAAYIGEALRRLGTDGHLATFEGMIARCRMTREALGRMHLEQWVELIEGNFDHTINHYLEENQPIDFMFSDGDKDPDRTWAQFQLGLGAMADGGHMFFDDINFNDPISRVWREIVAQARVTSCATFLDRWGLLTVSAETGS